MRAKNKDIPWLLGIGVFWCKIQVINIFREQLKSIGYPEDGLRMVSSNEDVFSDVPSVSIKNTKNVDLYVLILAAKHKLAQKIWNSIIKIDPDGQTRMF